MRDLGAGANILASYFRHPEQLEDRSVAVEVSGILDTAASLPLRSAAHTTRRTATPSHGLSSHNPPSCRARRGAESGARGDLP